MIWTSPQKNLTSLTKTIKLKKKTKKNNPEILPCGIVAQKLVLNGIYFDIEMMTHIAMLHTKKWSNPINSHKNFNYRSMKYG